MFAHLRFSFSTVIILASLFALPAYSNPIAGQPEAKVATERSAAPAAAQETCLSRPGNSAIAGQRWVYHTEGHRKCWFQAAEQPQLKKRVRYPAAKASVAASAKNESMPLKPKRVEDARAELMPLDPETSQALPSALGPGIAAVAPTSSGERAPLLSSEVSRLEPANVNERRQDADLSVTQPQSQRVASVAPLAATTPPVYFTSATPDDTPGWPTTWIAVLFMTLGFCSILGSDRAVRDMMMRRYKGTEV